MVVDDETGLLEATVRLLRLRGYDVAAAESGEEALRQLAEESFDLLLLDIRMPGVDGFDIYRHIQRRTPALARRIVFVTGDITATGTHKFLARTKARHIVKPFSAERLRKEVRRALAENS